MRARPPYKSRALLLSGSVLAALVLALGSQTVVQVVEIGISGVAFRVSDGDLLSHEYTHSMYGAQVIEKFRIEDGNFRLFHVMTQSDAVLEYFGIEKRNEHNVDGKFREFTIPAASIGKHVLRLQNRELSLDTPEHSSGRIHVRLVQIPFRAYVSRLIRR